MRSAFAAVHCLVLCGLAGLICGGIPSRSVAASDYLIDVWSGDNGLPNSSVTAIAQTPDGYLWVGTHNGLARFDGVRFVNFEPHNTPELKHARIAGLFLDSQNTLWINTYDGSLTSWRNGRFTHEWHRWAGLQMARVFTRSNDLVFATMGGDLVLRRHGADPTNAWHTLSPASRSVGSAYHQDRHGVLWHHTRDGRIGRIIGSHSEILPEGLGLDGRQVNCLAADHSGDIWVGTDKGIARWNGNRFENFTPTNGEPGLEVSFLFCASDDGIWTLANNRIRKCVNRQWVAETPAWGELFGSHMPALGIHEDRQGSIWFRHFGQGVFKIRPDGTPQRISAADGLPGDRITCWLQDREDNIWVGVDRGGLVHLRPGKFQVVGATVGASAQAAASVCEDGQGNIWIGAFGAGLNRWAGGKLTSFTSTEDTAAKFVFSVCSDAQGRLWLSAGREDLFVCEQERITRPSWDVHGVKALFTDHQGRVWIGKNRGLSCISDGALKSFSSSDGIERTDIHAIAEDKDGEIWIGGGNGTLYEFDDGRLIPHRPDDKPENETIWSLLPDRDGTLWIGTFRGGLLRYRDGRFTRFTSANGLPSDVICQILDDGRGKLWIGSHKGIFSVAKSALHQFASGALGSVPCSSYGTYDGLPTLECSGGYQPAAWRGRDGRLWFTTFKGVVSIQPAEIPVNRLAPGVVLEDVLVGGKSLFAGATNRAVGRTTAGGARSKASTTREPAGLTIPPGKRQFEFHYAAPSFIAPEKVRFRYRLEGLDEDWIEAGGQRSAQYGYLRPGQYRFHVIAGNNNGVWNETGASVAFNVLPHFWETWWFRGSLMLAFLAGVAGVVRVVTTRKLQRELERLEQQRAIERDRERIAKDIHDDLGAGLTQIMLQSALARREPQEEVQTHLTQISETAREMVRTMDEIVWAVDPENDTLDGLVTYAGKFVQEYVTLAGLRCRLDLPPQLPHFSVSAEARHNLFLAIKEALNNAIKHARATEIFLQLRMHPSAFTLVIRDNGRGFVRGALAAEPEPASRISSGRGLRNMVQRLEQIGGHCTIRSELGKGTEIELTVMIQPDRAAKSKNRDFEMEAINGR